MSSFKKLSVKELKSIIATYRKEHLPLVRYSKLKKNELITVLESKFTLKDGNLYLKSQSPAVAPVQKAKKRITPTPVAPTPKPSDLRIQMNADMNKVRTDDQEKFNAIVRKLDSNKATKGQKHMMMLLSDLKIR